ncbi:MAG: cache domain-containing protein [Caulobacteraceae bacterium]|nr:cache domain-containing protein [Caulobacteraceae bacterium]
MNPGNRNSFRAAMTLGVALVLSASGAAFAQTATKPEAIAMVKSAVAALKGGPDDAVFKDISNPKGKYAKGDLYLVAYDMTGKVLAHGFNQSLIGRDLTKAKDPDGKSYVQERIDMAKTQKSFWQSYRYLDPLTHSLRLKDSYCERTGDTIVCGGVYH